jgi:hypothetical protein
LGQHISWNSWQVLEGAFTPAISSVRETIWKEKKACQTRLNLRPSNPAKMSNKSRLAARLNLRPGQTNQDWLNIIQHD